MIGHWKKWKGRDLYCVHESSLSTPHLTPSQTVCFLFFFPLQVGDLLSNIFSAGKIHFYIKFMAGLMQISENNIVGQNWTEQAQASV